MSVALPLANKIVRSSSKKVELRVISGSFGDGYGQRAARGKASLRDSWDITWESLTLKELQELQSFFYEQGSWGVISYTPPYEASNKNFRAANSLTSSFDGFNHWTASISLKESTVFTVLEAITFPTTSYAITPAITSVGEGSSVMFTVTTTGITDGTILYWSTITSGGISDIDFDDNSLTGSVTITGDSGTITRAVKLDTLTEGEETFALQLREGSVDGNILATSAIVTISDTSLTPDPYLDYVALYFGYSNVNLTGIKFLDDSDNLVSPALTVSSSLVSNWNTIYQRAEGISSDWRSVGSGSNVAIKMTKADFLAIKKIAVYSALVSLSTVSAIYIYTNNNASVDAVLSNTLVTTISVSPTTSPTTSYKATPIPVL
jgi:phage-related protein